MHGSSLASTRSRGETEYSWILCAARNGTANCPALHLGVGRLDKDEARTAIMEMPEMLYKLCLVARELELSYAACSIGVRIGNPCHVWLLHDALFLEGSSDAVHTPRRKF